MASNTYGKGRALCVDGKVRAVRLTAQSADTWFSWPASTTFGGKTVTGFLVIDSEEGEEGTYIGRPWCGAKNLFPGARIRFVANSYGVNGHLLP